MRLWAMINTWPVTYQHAAQPLINRCSFARAPGDVITVVFERSEYHQALIAQMAHDGKPSVDGLRAWYRARPYFKVSQVELQRLSPKRR